MSGQIYLVVAVNVPGRLTEVKSMCGKHWTTCKLGIWMVLMPSLLFVFLSYIVTKYIYYISNKVFLKNSIKNTSKTKSQPTCQNEFKFLQTTNMLKLEFSIYLAATMCLFFG